MCAVPAKLADFSHMSPVRPRQFCKTFSVLGMRSTVSAEAPANMAETPNEQGAAMTEDYHSSIVENESIEIAKT